MQRIQLTSLPFLYHQPCYGIELSKQLQPFGRAHLNPHGKEQSFSRQIKGEKLSSIGAALHPQGTGRLGGGAQHMHAVIDPARAVGGQIAHPEPGGVFQAVLLSAHAILRLQNLRSGSGASGEEHLHGVRPRSGIFRLDHDRPLRAFGAGGVLRGRAHDVAGAAAVGEKLLYRVGQVAVFPVFQFREIPAKPALVLGKAGQQDGPPCHRPLFRQTDKSGRTGPNSLHGLDAGIKFLHIDAWRQIFCHLKYLPSLFPLPNSVCSL